jgi:predicted AAA+ superfamily ATPase
MEEVIVLSNRLISDVSLRFQRSLNIEIDWSQALIEIRGSRGVVKTTMLLQHAKYLKQEGKNVVYASLDTPFFFSNSLYEFADEFRKYGGEYLILDEVHRYPSKHKDSDWSLEIKNIFDAFSDIKIVYSGSSILHLYKGSGDLSRRKSSYLLNGLSFREYLEFNQIHTSEPIDLNTLLTEHERIATKLSHEFKPLFHFKEYLKYGFYPFYTGNEIIFYRQLQDVVNLIIESDLPYLAPISNSAKEQLKRLLGAISSTVPYVPNMNTLGELVHVTDHRTLIKYLNLLGEAQLIHLVRSPAKGNKQLQKPDKILINNPNLMYALGAASSNPGSMRETFFYSQLSPLYTVHSASKGDFIANGEYLFEVGGKNKGKKQISGVQHAYIAADDIEIGFGNKIPLWLFGFLY